MYSLLFHNCFLYKELVDLNSYLLTNSDQLLMLHHLRLYYTEMYSRILFLHKHSIASSLSTSLPTLGTKSVYHLFIFIEVYIVANALVCVSLGRMCIVTSTCTVYSIRKCCGNVR